MKRLGDAESVDRRGIITITADDRERGCEVLHRLSVHPDVALEVLRLRTGDYFLDGKVLVERKSSVDAAASVIDGRFFSQSRRLAQSGIPSIIVIEGEINEKMRKTVICASLTAQLLFGVGVIFCRDPDEVVCVMLSAVRQAKNGISGAVKRHGYRPKGLRRRKLFLLQGLPGVGPERAAALLDALGSVEAVMSADENELMKIAGIGGNTAGGIRRISGDSGS